MNPSERKLLDKLDSLVINASKDELKQIQEVDFETQLEGKSFYDSYIESKTLANQSIKREIGDPKK